MDPVFADKFLFYRRNDGVEVVDQSIFFCSNLLQDVVILKDISVISVQCRCCGSYDELKVRLLGPLTKDPADAVTGLFIEIKRIESRSAELTLVMKHAGTYRQLKPLYGRYRKSNDKEKFLRGHESKIILFEAAARELKRLGAVPLPTTESMKTELANLTAEKERLLAEYKAARTEAQEYETVKQNVDALLTVPKEQVQKQVNELE